MNRNEHLKTEVYLKFRPHSLKNGRAGREGKEMLEKDELTIQKTENAGLLDFVPDPLIHPYRFQENLQVSTIIGHFAQILGFRIP